MATAPQAHETDGLRCGYDPALGQMIHTTDCDVSQVIAQATNSDAAIVGHFETFLIVLPPSRLRSFAFVLCRPRSPAEQGRASGQANPWPVMVEYQERLKDGPRHAALKGLRLEKKPGLIRRSPLSERGPF